MNAPRIQIYEKLDRLVKNNISAKIKAKKLPLFVKPVAGKDFTVPTVAEGTLDLNSYLIKDHHVTFLIRVTGNSMINAGINTGDILVVDSSVEADSGKIVVAEINGKITVKRYFVDGGKITLAPENEQFPPIKIKKDDKFEIWGVVSSSIKSL